MHHLPPLHRSLLFWAGLLIITFFAWLAHNSLTTSRSLHVGLSPTMSLGFESSQSLVSIFHRYRDYAAGSPRLPLTYYQSSFPNHHPTYFPAPWIGSRIEVMHARSRTGCQANGDVIRGASLPCGLLIALFVPPWILLSLRRAKRIARLKSAVF